MSSSVGSLQNLGKTELTPTGVSVFIRGLAATSPSCAAAQKDRTSYSELTRVATRNTSAALLLRSIFLESFGGGGNGGSNNRTVRSTFFFYKEATTLR